MMRLRSPHSPSPRQRRVPRPSRLNGSAVKRALSTPTAPGRYLRTWGGYSVEVTVIVAADGRLVDIAPTGLVSPLSDLPGAVWTPISDAR